MAEPSNTDAWLRTQLDSLDSTMLVSEHGPEFDAMASLYVELPESPMSETLGGDIRIDFDAEYESMHVRPIAVFGGSLVVQSLIEPHTSQDDPPYYFFRGSMFFPDDAIQKHGAEAIAQVALFLVSRGQSLVGNLDSGISVAYNPYTFCKDSQLVYAPAYAVEHLRRKSIRTRGAAESIPGMVLTVQPAPNQPLTLFVENDYDFSPPIKQVVHRVGNDYRRLLSYVPD